MNFVRKKDLKIVGPVSVRMVQFQVEDYCKNFKIIIRHLEQA